jgi:hypothetical protein
MIARGWLQVAVVAGAVATAGEAAAFPKGAIIITEHEVDTKSPTFEKDLKKAARDSLNKGVEGWNLFLVAYLKKAAGADEVNLVFYELKGKGRGEQINAFPIATSAKAEILASTVAISPEQGFKAGTRYEVLITRLVGGKEDVYARTTLSLK